MKNLDEHILTLENFEGPVDLLLHLVQKNEMDICGIHLKEITKQYIQFLTEAAAHSLDGGAEFISTTAALMLLKSRALLPKHEADAKLSPEELDPRFEIIHYLLDYCRFKSAAEDLRTLEERQVGYHLRGMPEPIIVKPSGVGPLSLSDLCVLFQQVLSKASDNIGFIQEEEWKVSDKIEFIREKLQEVNEIPFLVLFRSEMYRIELIITFLAVLELMKQGEIKVMRRESGEIVVEGVSPC